MKSLAWRASFVFTSTADEDGTILIHHELQLE